MPWLELSVAASQDHAESASEILEAHGAAAVTLAGADDEALLEPLPGEQPLWQRVLVRALVEADADLRTLADALAPVGARLVDVEFVAEEDWQNRWRAHAARGCFGGRLWLLPRDEPPPPDAHGAGAVLLRLDPGLAFGSGSHPTTRLCLEGLAGLPLSGARVLDFGCGSGVLAVAAALLGAREVVAVDHDPQALLATADNATYNAVTADRLRVSSADALAREEGEVFHVVVANILANPLVALAGDLTGLTARDGVLMLSGLLADQEPMIRQAYPDMTFAPAVREGDWIRLDGHHRDSTG